MCGICGVRRFGPEPITESQIRILLCANEHRGNDATGLALQDPDGNIHVIKNDVPAWKFCSSKEFSEFLQEFLNEDTMVALGHTRAATKGNPEQNQNNHPIFAGKSAVIHNGMIHNDDFLFKDLKIDRKAEVDSDILRGIIDKYGITKKAIEVLKRVNGSCALAAIHPEFPGKMLLGRCGSPLVLASTEHQLVWSSEKNALHAAMRPVLWRFGFPMQSNTVDLAFMTMSNDSIYIVGEPRTKAGFTSALDWHEQFQTATYYNTPRYQVHDNYGRHQKRWSSDDKPKLYWCPKCEQWLTVTDPKLKAMLPEDLICKTCKSPLEARGLIESTNEEDEIDALDGTELAIWEQRGGSGKLLNGKLD